MGKAFKAFKILMAFIIVGLFLVPITSAISLAIYPFQFYQNPLDTLNPGAISNNGVITKNTTIYIYNPGLYDINSLLFVTSVLNSSFYVYGEPTYILWPIPRGSIIPYTVVMAVNTSQLSNEVLGDFLNTTSFYGQIIFNVRYAYALTSLSNLQITPWGTMSPMYNLSHGPAVRDYSTNTTANVTFGFLNFLQGYTLNIYAELRNASGLVANSSINVYSVPSATMFTPAFFLENITLTVNGVGTLKDASNYTLSLIVTSPFSYNYTKTGYTVV
ncbi:MAG: hypothetical protein ACUVXA_03815 [Candidatus Jordarchaeum sp.]|uniref:hypothetical protein n=1 Tax=Candidatus Jordarchaeum sp. TaxID=2823881 RepID=UPI004049F4BA